MAKVVEFCVSHGVGVPNDAVWDVLGKFGNEHQWTETVRRCERDTVDVHVGTVRRCTLPRPLMGRTEAVEQLTEFDPGRVLSYALDGPAGPFASAASSWSTSAGRQATVVSVRGTFTLNGVVGRRPGRWSSRCSPELPRVC